jgi:hypothetical protein
MKAMMFGATILAASGLALCGGSAALAQTPAARGAAAPPANGAPTTTPAPTPPAADASATTGFRAGLPVKDAQGTAIGTIARVIKTPDGATTYSVSVDGRNVNLPGSALTLSPSGAEAISTMSKAQITASTAPPS